MTEPLQYQPPPLPRGSDGSLVRNLAATGIAFVAGALAWALPPHVLGKIVEHYPETRWAWLGDGLWNGDLWVSVPAILVVGFAYGWAVPKYWYASLLATWWVLPFNISLDLSRYPTSHNLFPFELVGFGVLNLPTLAGALMGKLVSPLAK